MQALELPIGLAVSLVLSLIGIVFWRRRMQYALGDAAAPSKAGPCVPDDALDVSIIVPARNEAHNLPALLRSLKALTPPAREIIVVDDHSDDGTAAVARSFGATVVTPPPLPADWNGKPWACQAGAKLARGSFLLFTDADTVHAPTSLSRVVAEHGRTGAGLVSVIPTHLAAVLWEKLQGVFHLLLLIATGAGTQRDSGERRFTIGQYIFMPRTTYQAIGGHHAVATRIAEDLAMGRLVADKGETVATLFSPGLLSVRMYPEGLQGFLAGWRRSFFEGMSSAGPMAGIEVTLVIAWLLGSILSLATGLLAGDMLQAGVGAVLYALATGSIAFQQRKLGSFPLWSAPFYLLFLIAFIAVSTQALWDRMSGARVHWKGREVVSR